MELYGKHKSSDFFPSFNKYMSTISTTCFLELHMTKMWKGNGHLRWRRRYAQLVTKWNHFTLHIHFTMWGSQLTSDWARNRPDSQKVLRVTNRGQKSPIVCLALADGDEQGSRKGFYGLNGPVVLGPWKKGGPELCPPIYWKSWPAGRGTPTGRVGPSSPFKKTKQKRIVSSLHRMGYICHGIERNTIPISLCDLCKKQ